jgi:hypothetical protein
MRLFRLNWLELAADGQGFLKPLPPGRWWLSGWIWLAEEGTNADEEVADDDGEADEEL